MTKKTLKIVQYGLLLILVLLLFIGGSQNSNTRSLINLWDLGHVVLFALLFNVILRNSKWLYDKRILLQIIIIVTSTIIIGILIEWIQLFIGRTAEFIDVLRNVIGAMLAFSYSKSILKLKKNTIKIIRIVTLLLLLLAAWPLIKSLTDEIQSQIRFPIIADFEDVFEIDKWYGVSNISLSEEFVKHGKYSLKTELLTNKYSGISVNYFPSNWKNYTSLKFSIYSKSDDPLILICRIHDKNHSKGNNEKFDKKIVINSGWNDFSFSLDEIIDAPKERKLDIENLKNFTLFAVRLKQEKTIYFDYLRLE